MSGLHHFDDGFARLDEQRAKREQAARDFRKGYEDGLSGRPELVSINPDYREGVRAAERFFVRPRPDLDRRF